VGSKVLSAPGAVLVSLLVVIAGFFTTSTESIVLSLAAVALCSVDFRVRARLGATIRLLVLSSCLLVLIAAARVIGGATAAAVIDSSVAKLALFARIIFAGQVLLAIVRPKEYLHFLDAIRMPRDLTYVVLSALTLFDYVGAVGRRQLRFLWLKGLTGGTLAKRTRAYARISGPLVSVLLRRQLLHVRSLEYRGFFDADLSPSETQGNKPPMGQTVSLLALLWSALRSAAIWI